MDKNSAPPPPLPRLGSDELRRQRQVGSSSPAGRGLPLSIAHSPRVQGLPQEGSRIQGTPASVTGISLNHATSTVYRSIGTMAPRAHQFTAVPHMNTLAASMNVLQPKNDKAPIRIIPEIRQSTPVNSEPQHCLYERGVTTCEILAANAKLAIVQVSDALLDLEVDAVFRPQKHKWKCVSYSDNRCLIFRVFMYLSEKQGVYTLAVEKRQGCAFHFTSLFNSFKHELSKMKILCLPNGNLVASSLPPRPVMALAPPPLPQCIAETMTVQIEPSCLLPLIEMSRSKYTDVQKEGVRELANQASKSTVRTVLGGMTEVYALLGELCSSSDEDVVRCAAATVNGLARDVKFHKAIVQGQFGIVRRLVTISMDRQSDFSHETRRICAIAVAQLSAGECGQNVMQTAGPKFFDMLRSTQDKRLKSFAAEANIPLVH